MRVLALIEYIDIENENGIIIEGVCASCSRCNYYTEAYGTSDISIKRCLAELHEECPNNENNFYYDE